MNKIIITFSVFLCLHSTICLAQWVKIDDPNLELRTLIRHKYDTGFIIGNSLKQGIVISKDGGLTFQKFKSPTVPNAYYFENDTIYVGGYYNRVLFTTDYGTTFKDITTEDIKNQGVNCFAKYDENTLLVGTLRNGIYTYNKSTKVWKNIGHKDKDVNAILVKGRSIFAAVRFEDVSKSDDLGASWESVISTNNNSATDLIEYKGSIIMSTIGTGMKISYNDGAQWESINTGLTGSTKTGNSLVVSKDENHLFMIGFGSGVYYYDEKNKQWENITKDLPRNKKGEDMAISGNRIFVDGFPIDNDNTSFIYSLNIDGIISSSKDNLSNIPRINIFPNPSYDMLNITLPDGINDVNFYIFDNQFREIKMFSSNNTSSLSIDISSLRQGNYILKTELTKGTYFTKFTKI